MNKLQVINELFFLAILYHLLVFTDYARTAETKFNAGWSMLLISLTNFLWPNLYGMIIAIAPEMADAIKSSLNLEPEDSGDLDFFTQKRKQLIEKYQLKLKHQEKELIEWPLAKRKQVTPETTSIVSSFELRQTKYRQQKKVKKLPPTKMMKLELNWKELQLTEVEEKSQEFGTTLFQELQDLDESIIEKKV